MGRAVPKIGADSCRIEPDSQKLTRCFCVQFSSTRLPVWGWEGDFGSFVSDRRSTSKSAYFLNGTLRAERSNAVQRLNCRGSASSARKRVCGSAASLQGHLPDQRAFQDAPFRQSHQSVKNQRIQADLAIRHEHLHRIAQVGGPIVLIPIQPTTTRSVTPNPDRLSWPVKP